MTQAPKNLLRIDSSARITGSVTRMLTDHLVEQLSPSNTVSRNVASGTPFIDEAWVAANFTPVDQRTNEQKATLAHSDDLVSELQAADTIVISAPAYNFSVPASLKAWIDLIGRAGVTFRYTENGPEGLLENKKAYIVFASGGTPAGAEYDFASTYLKHVLGFIGITDVTMILADQVNAKGEAAIEAAKAEIQKIAA